jgi:hypothetical protein
MMLEPVDTRSATMLAPNNQITNLPIVSGDLNATVFADDTWLFAG